MKCGCLPKELVPYDPGYALVDTVVSDQYIIDANRERAKHNDDLSICSHQIADHLPNNARAYPKTYGIK
jgi:hypothetical protein